MASGKRVAIVGGGLAGLAAAAALTETGVTGAKITIELFEARRQLGGRAGSFFDAESGEWIDHCQHVAMGCCVNFLDFCRQTGLSDLLERHDRLHVIDASGKRHDLQPATWLPAPLHWLPAMFRMRYLSVRGRWGIVRTMRRLIRAPHDDREGSPTMDQWLRGNGASRAAIDGFWAVVLVSALGESLDRASVSAARKVFVDGFLASREAAALYLPRVSLGELYDRRAADSLTARGVAIHRESPIDCLDGTADGIQGLVGKDGAPREFDAVVLAVPWRRAGEMLSAGTRAAVPTLAAAERLAASPISGVHLWFDRQIMDVLHAVLLGRLSQWVFAKSEEEQSGENDSLYYQVVISASRELAGRNRDDVIREVQADLCAAFPAARSAQLLRAKVVTDPHAVFSAGPGSDALRPPQTTPVMNLFFAGDWTATGWPATMEGAVRSGRLAAEGVLQYLGEPRRCLVPDLPRGCLARWFL